MGEDIFLTVGRPEYRKRAKKCIQNKNGISLFIRMLFFPSLNIIMGGRVRKKSEECTKERRVVVGKNIEYIIFITWSIFQPYSFNPFVRWNPNLQALWVVYVYHTYTLPSHPSIQPIDNINMYYNIFIYQPLFILTHILFYVQDDIKYPRIVLCYAVCTVHIGNRHHILCSPHNTQYNYYIYYYR